MARRTKNGSLKPDVATLAGLVLAVGGIVGGLILEKGKIQDITHLSPAIIVLGGTFGAVLVSMPMKFVVGAIKRLKQVILEQSQSPEVLIEEIIEYATKARKNGLVSLEEDASRVADRFLRKALTLAVDGTDLQEIRKMLELEIGLDEHHAEAEAKVFEAAGGYAPTIGIIGAVLGLIQVMKNLSNIDEVGRGIAVAFVATVYGVGIANVFLLPAANKIKSRAHAELQMKELIVEGVAGIIEGLNPKLIRSKLEAYSHADAPAKTRASDGKTAKAGAAARAEA
jgi:chemotaxis protein MotA